MQIEFDRESVCMADDCSSHVENRQIEDVLMTSELLEELARYVPAMKNVIWAIYSVNCRFGQIVGYIITDNQAKSKVKLNVKDLPLRDLLCVKDYEPHKNVKTPIKIHMFCRYYHEGRFIWRDGKTGNLAVKYPECTSLLEKVMRDCSEGFNNDDRRI